MAELRPKAVVVGASAGGIAALRRIIALLPAGYPLPVIAALHVSPRARVDYPVVFGGVGRVVVEEAVEKQHPEPGHVYLAPPGYHLLMERDHSFSLSVDEPVNWSRPSIDVLFESAAEAYGAELLGVLLTGGNHDGAKGLKAIADAGGRIVVENPATAEVPVMPRAGLDVAPGADVLDLDAVAQLLRGLG